MFLTLLIATLAISIVVCTIVVKLFNKPLNNILARIIKDEISTAWKKYILFALYVVGISSGVQFYKLEQYAEGAGGHAEKDWVAPVLTNDTWVLEVYRTVISTLQGVAWALLLFFLVSMIAFVIVKGREMKTETKS